MKAVATATGSSGAPVAAATATSGTCRKSPGHRRGAGKRERERGGGARALPAQLRRLARGAGYGGRAEPGGALLLVLRGGERRGERARPGRPGQARRSAAATTGKMLEPAGPDPELDPEDLVHFSVGDLPSRGYGVMGEIRRQGKLCDVTLKLYLYM
ncbi:UNVERIFIED_CONTAM: hypothetical protein K2H54_001151 [Gekko kuhli]